MTVTVALWTAGGPGIGAGHLSRCRSLAFALRDGGARVHVVADAPAETLALFDWQQIPVQQVSAADAAHPERWNVFGDIDQHRVVVSDRPGVQPGDVAAWRAAGADTIAHLCDDGADRLPVDLFINGDVAPPELQVLAPLVRTGPAWHIVRPEAVRLRSQPWQGDRIDRVLLSLGAADPGACTATFVTALAAGPPPPFDMTVVAHDDVTCTLPSIDRVTVIAPTPALPALIAAHDLVVTFPGLTAYEAACIGTPVALIEWSHLASYARAMVGAGLAATLGDASIAAERLSIVARDVGSVRTAAACAYAAIDGQGAARIAALILQHANGQRIAVHPSRTIA